MITKVSGDKPFQVMAETFCISPSNEGYTLQFSADGTSYTDLMAVGAGINKTVTEQAVGTYYRCIGNATEVTVTSGMDCNTGGGGSTYILPKASASTLGGVKIGSGISIDADGKISASGGGGGGSVEYKYFILGDDEFVSSDFLSALIACGDDNLKIAEMAREVALKVELPEGQGYAYFPVIMAHKWYDNVLFMCGGMQAQHFGGFYYKVVVVTGDEAGKCNSFLGGSNLLGINS